MNILYLADPNSIHDEKWISYFSSNILHRTYLLPRSHQMKTVSAKASVFGAVLLEPISDFSIIRFYKTLATALRIKSIIKKEKIELIHILYAEPNALWSLFRKYFGVPIIISTRGTDVLKTIPEAFKKKTLINYLVAPAYKKAFQNADWITGTSKKQLLSISSLTGRSNNMSIIRTGVDTNRLKEAPATSHSLSGHDKYILFPRYIRPIYNHEFCLEAIRLLPSEFKRTYKMVFIGNNSGDPLYQKTLENKMKEIAEVDFVFLEKQTQDELFKLYKNASLVIMTPLSDGSPVSAMEALLCGTKLILGPLDYDEEIFSETTTILKNWSTSELTETMIDALNSYGSLTLPSKVKQLMDRDYNMSQLDLLYKGLLDGI